MRKSFLKSRTVKTLGVSLLVLFMTVLFAPSGFAAFEKVAEVANATLDGLEEAVVKTGIVDAKQKLWKEYNLLIKPYFKFRYDLTSNVFQAPDTHSNHTDNIWTFTPGVQFLYKNKYGVIGGAYEADFKYFSKFSEQNTQDQKFLVYANLFPTKNTYVRVSERLEQTGATAGSSAFEPIDYTDNVVTVVAGYTVKPWTFEFGYENFDRNFSNAIAKRYNHNEDKYDYRLYYQLTEKVKVFTGARIGWVDYSKTSSRDTFYYEFPVGIIGTLPSGINLNASVGFHRRNLEESNRNDVTHVVTNVSLEKTINHDRTSLQAGFLRRPVESTFSTATTYDEKMWYGQIKHLMTRKLRSRLKVYVGNRDFEERVFTGTRVVVGGAVFVTPPMQVKRDDDIFGINVGFDYNVRKWLILHMDYEYNRRDSNVSALDYTENVLTLRSTIPL